MVRWKEFISKFWPTLLPVGLSIVSFIIGLVKKDYTYGFMVVFVFLISIGFIFLISLSSDIDENKKDLDLKLKELNERQVKLEENLNIYSILAEHTTRLKSLESNKIKRGYI